LIAAVAVIGMPPLSGFIGKVWLLKATLNAEYTVVFWPLYLLASLAILVGVSKAGSTVFWHHQSQEIESAVQERVHPVQLVALIFLLSGGPLMSIFAGPLSEYAIGAATQLHDFNHNINVILSGGQ
jgi:multicomponent K+:H+ antiporter subunit D